ncbi:POT family-domain-containing protein [Syncephalis fuscata]|nr:POT family-domain-containing protein [Syncephalis fuscata]
MFTEKLSNMEKTPEMTEKNMAAVIDFPYDIPNVTAMPAEAGVGAVFDELPLDAEYTVSGKIPLSAWFIVATELCERFSFYGASLLFVTYMISKLGVSPSDATYINRGFQFFAYFTAIIGAIIADAKLGKFRTILIFASLYLVGLVLLSASASPASIEVGFGLPGFIIATYIFIACGTGGIKSNVSTFVADQIVVGFQATKTPGVYTDSRITLEGVFRYFYWAINVGSLVGMFVCKRVEQVSNHAFAFMAPAIMFALGITAFICGRKRYITQKPSSIVLSKVYGCIKYAVANRNNGITVSHWLDRSKGSGHIWDDKFVDDLAKTLRGCKVFLFYPIYWALYGNMSDCFIIQGMDMRRPDWLGPEDPNLLNTISIVVAIPLFDSVIIPFLRRRGFRLGPITRITIGFAIVTCGFVYATIMGHVLYNTGPFYDFANQKNPDGDFQNDLSIWWQFVPYVAIGISEIFASATGLEFAYKSATPELKSIVMSLFLLTNCGGSLIGLAVGSLSTDPYIVVLLGVETAVMAAFTVLFYYLFRHLDNEDV